MGHRSLALLLSAAIALTSQVASALGLGEINLKSNLNQPLEAEIRLLQLRDLTEQEILIGLASREDFQRLGVDRPYFLTDLEFEVDLNAANGPTVRVTSQKPVREPYLNFIVQAQWPSGKILREYTLLLDLPTFSEDQAQPVAAAETRQPAQEPAAKKPPRTASDTVSNPRSSFTPEGRESARPTTARQSAAPSTSEYAGVDVYGPVKSSQTLWEIAADVRPDNSVSVQQTMLAIQRLNPDAFINNNINLLKRGQVLRIPDGEQIREISRQQAVANVARQNAEFSGRSGDMQRAQISGSRDTRTSSTSQPSGEGRLRLTSPDDASGTAGGRASGSGDSSSDVTANDLAILQEELEKTRRENEELRARLESIEEQLDAENRLVELQSEQMRELELATRQRNEQQAQADAEQTDVSAQPETDEAAEDSAADQSAAAEPQQAESQQDQAAEPQRDPSRVITQPQEKTIVDLIMDNIIFVALGAVVLLGAIALAIRARNNKDQQQEDDFLDQTVFDSSDADEQDDLIALGDLDDDSADEDRDLSVEAEDAGDDEVPAEAETGDVAAEADIYIAYGKYDQAEEMLTNALDRDPANMEARMKLLEVYAGQDDAARFDPHFAKVYAAGDADLVERAQQLRAGLSDAGDFDPDLFDVSDVVGATISPQDEATGGDDDSLDFELDLDSGSSDQDFESLDSSLDLDLDDDASPEEKPGEKESQDSEENDFGSLDFDLGEPDDDAAVSEPEGDTRDAAEDDLSLDFDLDLDDSPEAEAQKPAAGDDSDTDEDDFSLDFDLEGLADEPAGEQDSAEDSDTGTTSAGEFDLSDEFLDLESDSGSADESAELREDDSIADNPEEDLGSIDFDLGLEDYDTQDSAASTDADDEDNSSLESDLAAMDEDLSLDDLDLGGLDDEADSSSESASSAEDEFDLSSFAEDNTPDSDEEEQGFDTDLESFSLESEPAADSDDLSLELEDDSDSSGSLESDLGELSLGDDEELSLEDSLGDSADETASVEEPETPAASEKDTEEAADEDDDLSDFDLEGDMDLSALDEELSALTGDLSAEEADSSLEGALSDNDELSAPETEEETPVEPQEPAPADEPETAPADEEPDAPLMEEPVTDFDDFEEDEPEADSDKSVSDMGDDTLFTKAISDIPDEDLEFEIPEIDPESVDDDSELGFLSDSDETATKLDLARAYIDMGDAEGARDIIDEVMKEGTDKQKEEAQSLLNRIQ